MVRILGIVGSPRVRGNTERVVAKALKAAEDEGAETELVRLAGKEVKSCDAYLHCRKTGDCRIKDDFKPIFAGYLSGAKGRVFENKVGGALVVARRTGQNFTFAQLLFFLLYQGMIVPGSTN